MERSLIWSALGLISRHGLLPIPIDDISAILDSAKTTKQYEDRINYNIMLMASVRVYKIGYGFYILF